LDHVRAALIVSVELLAVLAEAGHFNEHGQPFNPKSIVAMVR
jgi:hypothetical protein